jgi:hypothetical protein
MFRDDFAFMYGVRWDRLSPKQQELLIEDAASMVEYEGAVYAVAELHRRIGGELESYAATLEAGHK